MSDITPFHQRLIDEQQELQVRLGKLREFMGTAVFGNLDPKDQILLLRQKAAMEVYEAVLAARLLRLESTQEPTTAPSSSQVNSDTGK